MKMKKLLRVFSAAAVLGLALFVYGCWLNEDFYNSKFTDGEKAVIITAHNTFTENGSPDLFYKTFEVNDNVTSVVIPVNDEYYEIKNSTKPKKKVRIENETKEKRGIKGMIKILFVCHGRIHR